MKKKEEKDSHQCLGIIFGLCIVIYSVALVFYIIRPVASIFNNLDDAFANLLYYIFIYWNFIKIIPPILATILSVANGTSLPLSYALLLSLIVSSIGSLALDIVILNDYGRCNSEGVPFNPCNDLLYCCVFYASSSPNQCSIVWPCPSNYPSTKSELGINSDFVELGIFTTCLLAYELFLTIFALLIRKTRHQREREWLDTTTAEFMEGNVNIGASMAEENHQTSSLLSLPAFFKKRKMDMSSPPWNSEEASPPKPKINLSSKLDIYKRNVEKELLKLLPNKYSRSFHYRRE